MRSLTALLALLPASPLAGAAVQSRKPEPPPGMVLIEGGRTKVGTPPKEIEQLLQEATTLQAAASGFLGETPQNIVDVADFFLMVTEVTNEQFAAYVTAMQARPPQHWGRAAIDKARDEYLAAQGEERRKAIEAGETPPKGVAFIEAEWWAQNWRDAEFKLPDKAEKLPVVYVDFQDAVGYARWAGLRLMTEEEYQRAVRGDTDDPYPWGNKWEDGKYAATSEITGTSNVFPVGSFPEGASKAGVQDLAGNAWEWTSSKYKAYEGYEAFKITVGAGKQKKIIDALPAWNADERVVVSGSHQNPRFMARCTTRRGADRFQQTSALGFRCAASTAPGRDMALTVLDEIPNEMRPRDVDGPLAFQLAGSLAMDRWKTAPAPKVDNVPGYGVIAGYDFIVFTPVERVYGSEVADLRKYTLDQDLVTLGFVSTNQKLIDPALDPGTYIVRLRGAGEARPKPAEAAGTAGLQDEAAPVQETPPAQQPWETKLQFDKHVDNYIVFDLAGEPVAAIPLAAGEIESSNPRPGTMKVVDRTVTVTVGEGEDAEQVEEVQQWLNLEIFLPGRSRKGIKTTLWLRFAEGVLDGAWRQ